MGKPFWVWTLRRPWKHGSAKFHGILWLINHIPTSHRHRKEVLGESLVASSAPCMSQRNPAHKKKQKNEEKQAISTYLIKMGSNSHFWSHFSWKMAQQLKGFWFFHYFLTAKRFISPKTFSEIHRRLFLSHSSHVWVVQRHYFMINDNSTFFLEERQYRAPPKLHTSQTSSYEFSGSRSGLR